MLNPTINNNSNTGSQWDKIRGFRFKLMVPYCLSFEGFDMIFLNILKRQFVPFCCSDFLYTEQNTHKYVSFVNSTIKISAQDKLYLR